MRRERWGGNNRLGRAGVIPRGIWRRSLFQKIWWAGRIDGEENICKR